ncbi:hypothetical protein DFH07DRAFT_764364 [Mycena maculata]|uniref:Uncharacterized protein n=1 Tax=Mycena maculata TaxID=230809 RepID=A0AAD7KGB3_9AGAR|nr:hypothetical protein DFH07DRAFT_764364 [Mycena maculata]
MESIQPTTLKKAEITVLSQAWAWIWVVIKAQALSACKPFRQSAINKIWDRPINHSFASGTKWLAQAILPDAIKTGVDTACNEKSTTLSDAIKPAWAWFTQTKYALKTLFALSELSHCIENPVMRVWA